MRLVRGGEDPGVSVEAYSEKLREEIARERLQSRGTAHLPANREQDLIEITEEQRARYASRPRTRRWRALEKIDGILDALAQRHVEAIAKLQEAEGNVQQAPEQDARSLAAWLAGGEKRKRPEATLPERTRERDATRLLVEAIAVDIDAALEERRRHVERHRGRMIEEARRDVAEARDRLLAQVRGLGELQEALLDARATLAWVATFPEPAEGYGSPSALALGLRKPVQETMQTSARIEYRNLVAALEADVEALAARFADDVKRGLGEADPRTPLKGSDVGGRPGTGHLEEAGARARPRARPGAGPEPSSPGGPLVSRPSTAGEDPVSLSARFSPYSRCGSDRGFTANVAVTATTSATATTIVSSGAIVYENAPHLIAFYCARVDPPSAAAGACRALVREAGPLTCPDCGE